VNSPNQRAASHARIDGSGRVMAIYISRAILVLTLAVCGASATSSCAREGTAIPIENTNPKEQAEKLANSYGRSLGAEYRPFDNRNFVSFGEVSFRYDASKGSIIAYVFVTPVTMENPTPTQIAYRASFVRSLNDPEIGGMFENGGAIWVLDEALKGFFMTYEFPVSTTTSRQLRSKINELVAISGPWVVDWWGQVADIKDGVIPKPTRRITRADRR
jgi:hypothetical protein